MINGNTRMFEQGRHGGNENPRGTSVTTSRRRAFSRSATSAALLVSSALALVIASGLSGSAAFAQTVETTGDTNPSTGPVPIWNLPGSSILIIGNDGIGSISVREGDTLTSATNVVGNNPGSCGTVVVNGSGAFWSAADLALANQGIAELYIMNSAGVDTGSAIIGDQVSSAIGVVEVASGGTWVNAGEMILGTEARLLSSCTVRERTWPTAG